MDYAHQDPLSGGSPGKNTGVGCHVLLRGIFSTQGLNPGLLPQFFFFAIFSIFFPPDQDLVKIHIMQMNVSL